MYNLPAILISINSVLANIIAQVLSCDYHLTYGSKLNCMDAAIATFRQQSLTICMSYNYVVSCDYHLTYGSNMSSNVLDCDRIFNSQLMTLALYTSHVY